ncbi:autophagy-related protein 27 [Bombardia bombarda]|uniref:Autophagy-related protein 27 n=1 Tax=Bombardia bombarda TaxID=252184 RepID=A0AA39WCI8_9PEZI|nr:autophagy-related protein 27 [Bombardia bombarda]
MKPTSSSRRRGLPTTLVLLLSAAPAALGLLDCKAVVIEDHKFNLGALAGPHTAVTSEFSPPSYYNTTYTLDICAPLKRKGDVKKGDECPNGTRVCAIRHNYDPETKKISAPAEVVPVAGNLADHGGHAFSWDIKRLSTSTDAADKGKEGVRIALKGATGTEGEWESGELDQYVPGDKEKEKKREDEKKDGEQKDGEKKDGDDKKDDPPSDEEGTEETQLKKENAALVWDGYRANGKVDTLYLTWYTKYACEKSLPGDKDGNGGGKSPMDEESRHWGFFTWIVILAFLAIASYLIFGSWLNYNRYGARGWDLLPHGDTIRDVPYLLKDWTRRVLNTVQSSGSRGGYSAV